MLTKLAEKRFIVLSQGGICSSGSRFYNESNHYMIKQHINLMQYDLHFFNYENLIVYLGIKYLQWEDVRT